ncbi:ABC transporter substrate-binding protein [Butyrivibrio fibrisolvens]|uniref:ABC transporter substrate-binding protein n=1 Tax=Butyrivibrio fibrisolvens TaxID=831 RepID=UPI0003B33F0A|nr:extracellular solute-binding protein [Butyrivibrio fibrisolvens]
MKSKALSIVLSLSMVAAALTGCSVSTDTGETSTPAQDEAKDTGTDSGATDTGTGTDSTDTSTASADEEEITWVFWDDLEASTDQMTQLYAETVKRFNEADNGYHVNVITTNLEEYDSKVNALIAAGDTPDLLICNPGPNADVYVDAGVVQPLNQYLDADTEWKDSFAGGMFDRVTYDGDIYGIPTNFAAACCFYNTEMFEAAGISEVPSDMEGFLDACAKLKEAGYTPLTCSASTAWCLSMIAGYCMNREGVDTKALNAGTAHWTDENCVKGVEDLVAISKFFQDTYLGDSNDDATAHFYNEEAAILIQGSWCIAQMNGNSTTIEDKCGVFSFPSVDGSIGDMIVKTDNVLMSATTEHPEACVAFLKMLTDETAQKATAEKAGKIPVTKVEVDTSKAPKQFGYVSDLLANLTGTIGFYNESLVSVEAGDTFDNNMVSIVMGDETIEEGLQNIEDFYKENAWK